MKKDNIHVFKRNMDTINVTLDHILNGNNLTKEIIEGYFNCIRIAVDHCEELAMEDK